MSELIFNLTAADEDAEAIRSALGDIPFDEVVAHSMTGMEHDIAWLVGAALGSPVAVKLLDVLQKAHASRKIKKVTVMKDGKLIVEDAMPADAVKIIRALASRDETP